jgi:hypothetical protein
VKESYTPAAVAAAVSELVHAPNHARLMKQMIELATNPACRRDRAPSRILQPLVDLGRTDFPQFEKVLATVEEMRSNESRLKFTDYMREFMRERRLRLARAKHIKCLQQGVPLSTPMPTFNADQLALWSAARDRAVANRTDQSWAGKIAATRAFWGGVDQQQADDLLALSRKNTGTE